MRILGKFLIVAASLIIMAGCATRDVRQPAEYEHVYEIKASGIHEDCFEMTPGQKLECFFKATSPLDFNIHYHEDGKIFYPVKKDFVSRDVGEFTPEIRQYYCVMWSNPSDEAIKVSYTLNITEATPK